MHISVVCTCFATLACVLPLICPGRNGTAWPWFTDGLSMAAPHATAQLGGGASLSCCELAAWLASAVQLDLLTIGSTLSCQLSDAW